MSPRSTIAESNIESVSEFLCNRTGLFFSAEMKAKLGRTFQRRRAELGVSYIAYRTRVFQDLAEQQQLLRSVVNTETYFFREDYQLELLSAHILPDVLARENHNGPVVVWSTACSSGEEAYSVAIVAVEAGMQESKRLRIIGTDLLASNIAMARRARYGRKAFRVTSDRRKRAFFLRRGSELEVAPVVKSLCQFRQQNLLEMGKPSSGVQADVVLCRNALIYMTEQARHEALCNIYARLRPGGALLLGHAEIILDNSLPFETVRHGNLVYYRKPHAAWSERGLPDRCQERR